jgi:hypothetical protein
MEAPPNVAAAVEVADIVKMISEKFDHLLLKVKDFGLLPNSIIDHMIKHTTPSAKWFSVFIVTTALKAKIDGPEHADTIYTEEDFHTAFVEDMYMQLKSTMEKVSIDQAQQIAAIENSDLVKEKLPQFLMMLEMDEKDLDIKQCSKDLADGYAKLAEMSDAELRTLLYKFSTIALEYLKMFVHLCLQDRHWKEHRFTPRWKLDRASFYVTTNK